LLPVTSHNQTADIFTKAAGPRQFHACMLKLGMVDIYQPPTCEGVSAREENEEETKQKP
jgi:hypothetical protein